jgi:hypothetical protein
MRFLGLHSFSYLIFGTLQARVGLVVECLFDCFLQLASPLLYLSRTGPDDTSAPFCSYAVGACIQWHFGRAHFYTVVHTTPCVPCLCPGTTVSILVETLILADAG